MGPYINDMINIFDLKCAFHSGNKKFSKKNLKSKIHRIRNTYTEEICLVI